MKRETKYAKSGDVHIAYQVVGDGPIDLVFVMGWISHLDHLWEGPGASFLNRLASFSRLITFDKRGTGLSDRTGDLPTIEQRMDDVRAVMDAAGVHRAALMGMCESAAMCAVFAATYPERTAALVMYAAYAKREWHPDYPWAPTAAEREQFYEAIEHGWGGVVDLDTVAPSTAGDEPFRQWWARYLQQSASPGAALDLARTNTKIDIRQVLPAIRTPTLILHRTGDLDIDVGGARYLAAHIPGATYIELPGNDHLPFAGDQDTLLDEIEQFLTGMPPAAEPDRVLATILFTEIVGAIRIAAQLGEDRWQEIMTAHRRQVLELLARFRGREVTQTTSGILATFDGPARAIRCALAIVAQSAELGIEIRAGLHSGECVVRDSNILGVAAQIAARVVARADTGQVVVSSTITDLVAGSGIGFERVGGRLMIGTERGLDLYRVVMRQPAELLLDFHTGTSASYEPPGVAAALSPREREVAVLIGHGLTNRVIADELSISVSTVERHAANIFNKLGLHSRSQVAVWVSGEGHRRSNEV